MFIEQRLLDRLAYGTVNGPAFRTRRVSTRGSIIYRNPMNALPLYRFTILYRNLVLAQHEQVVQAFNACLAGVHAFRIKDYQDYTAEDAVLSVLGTGATQQVQLTKPYTFGPLTTHRKIRKPVAGVQMKASGSPLFAVVDVTTGMATVSAPAFSVLSWSGEFDVPVMFEEDELPFSGEDKNEQEGLILTGNVNLLEDRSQ